MNNNDRIQVIARIRPFTKTELIRGDQSIATTSNDSIHLENDGFYKSYKLDAVLDKNIDQSQVFERVEPLLESIMDGYNCSLLTYGQTGLSISLIQN
jgi:hypothetical protein